MRYPHDCSDCDFLGLLDNYDVYYCHRENTMIYRHGAEENYTTMSMWHVAESAKGK
jgi:hypothetical protein